MITETHDVAATLVQGLEDAWNAADGEQFGSAFADDAEFVTIRGELHRTRQAIAAGHQQIFSTIYQGSTVHYEILDSREIAAGVIVAHIAGTLTAPAGPLAGTHHALATIVAVQSEENWRIAAFHNTLQR
ncbi:hypothetical protein SE17_16225 [Kouleothrix aurantiaca]|uniref:DUF4440 domain-containing protein n=1 Tax=Kouleothrix aurantiaca TaxID=186479 RepID=A0A0P9HCR6_9CHLR|nr:hypothetical protein SE17_16225 [Kouleothrix aurantiaca]